MKSYEEVAQDVFERRDEYLREKRRRKKAVGKAASVTVGLCAGLLAVAGIWRISAADSCPAEGSPSELAGTLAAGGDGGNGSGVGGGNGIESSAEDGDGIESGGSSAEGGNRTENGNDAEGGSIDVDSDGAKVLADSSASNDSFPQGSSNESLTGASGSSSTVGTEGLSSAGSANLPVSYSSLSLPQGQIMPAIISEYAASSQSTADVLPFSEDMLADSSAILEGKITDMYLKRYNYDTYNDKFGPKEIYHNQSSSVVYELAVDKVWYGDQSLTGTSVLIEDDVYLIDSCFSLKVGCSYVIPVSNLDEEKWIWGEYAGGDLTRDGRYTTLYPFHPQIEVTLDGNYVVTSDWESLCTEDAQNIFLTADSAGGSYTDTFVEYHPENPAGPDGLITTEWRTLLISKNDAIYYYNKLKLIESDDFFIQLNRLIDRLP